MPEYKKMLQEHKLKLKLAQKYSDPIDIPKRTKLIRCLSEIVDESANQDEPYTLPAPAHLKS